MLRLAHSDVSYRYFRLTTLSQGLERFPLFFWALFNASNARRVCLKDAMRTELSGISAKKWVSEAGLDKQMMIGQ